MSTDIEIRFAKMSDLQELKNLQAHSFRVLGAPYYGSDVVEAFIEVGTMDPALLDEGTYLAAVSGGRVVGCGGWCLRTPSYATYIVGRAAPGGPTATVRSVYVHPSFARKGIARALMAAIEVNIAAAGLKVVSLAATLSGIPLYRRLGYRGEEPIILRLPTGHQIMTLAMTKCLARTTLKSVA
jgi:GNAT superfamily N-acetyltransferase